ncbi:UDP-N-acetylmuramoyl-tripeptide--D-alanyl-D-alanine ligase [Lachnoclostridium phytofermentans]|uniref:UDP-N-acetylmuramoyl-tripeptide--D-alanyl-D-alanine ligase n=1 Tax=Lachnoclostridium phytofermentans (strain ATCC 700394 / DSM 18823 / ISDg) TaxID=357809 RepID=A9KMA1_LACP7|nr:UDP-N-acetylmuramoyl-tripeptide--D-alanyl-D-alanine ligase [Lachnoclostridium phytofermentans]ABX42855.1 UDP-N-acetylmuramoylalanyl-D-glutamyl-2,6-diaminopimelate--D-alanyl-D-alanyl ligase [Lachnoclostridium phytofermentans ISDg]
MATFHVNEIATITGGTIIKGNNDRTIFKISTNSKVGDSDTLFVPIVGERVDAHDFIADAYRQGIRVTLTSKDEIAEGTEDMVYIKVNHTVEALQRLGEYHRDHSNVPIIGITGSVGKTTTKEMIAAAFSTRSNVLKTIGNMNSQVGLPQMMLMLEDTHEVGIIEMGMSEFGEMERIAKVAKPKMAVVTNIGVSHIGQLKTQENIRKEKLNIVNYFTEDSILLLNGDDQLLLEIYDEYRKDNSSVKEKTQNNGSVDLSEMTRRSLNKASVYTFGTNPDCTIYADNIKTDGESTTFTFHYKNGTKEELVDDITLSVLGKHNILNALAAIFFAIQLGIDPLAAKEGLKEYKPIAMRGEIEKVNGITIIDDTYNASPDSMKGAIHVIMDMPKEHKKFIVFADILELGDISKKCHYEVGEYLAKQCKIEKACGKESTFIDEVITIGEEAKYILDGVRENGEDINTKSFMEREEAFKYIKTNLTKRDVILLKGSRGMKLDLIVERLKEELVKC